MDHLQSLMVLWFPFSCAVERFLVHVDSLRVGESLVVMENMMVMIKRSTVIHLFWYYYFFVSKNICFKYLDLSFNTEWKDTHKINCLWESRYSAMMCLLKSGLENQLLRTMTFSVNWLNFTLVV